MVSPYGEEFRGLMARWDKQLLLEAIEDLKNRINALIGQHFILFLKKKEDDEVFGADENGRLMFAKMKSDDEDMPEGWRDQANFGCVSLTKALAGTPTQTVFGLKDLDGLDVLEDRDELIKMLLKSAAGKKDRPVTVKTPKNDKDAGAGAVKLLEPEGSGE